jgi:hypothetical protein
MENIYIYGAMRKISRKETTYGIEGNASGLGLAGSGSGPLARFGDLGNEPLRSIKNNAFIG